MQFVPIRIHKSLMNILSEGKYCQHLYKKTTFGTLVVLCKSLHNTFQSHINQMIVATAKLNYATVIVQHY